MAKLSHSPHDDPPALLICGHGSRAQAAAREFHQLVADIRRRCPERLCEPAFLELTAPGIPAGLRRLAGQGARRVTALPIMLRSGRHATQDIPGAIRRACRSAPLRGLAIRVGDALGDHPGMTRLAALRIERAERRFGAGYRRDSAMLVVVASGSSDAQANRAVHAFGQRLQRDLGFPAAVTAFGDLARPGLTETLQQLPATGRRHVLVFPYLLFAGRLLDRITKKLGEFSAGDPGMQVVTAGHLGPHRLVVDTLLARLREAEQGIA